MIDIIMRVKKIRILGMLYENEKRKKKRGGERKKERERERDI